MATINFSAIANGERLIHVPDCVDLPTGPIRVTVEAEKPPLPELTPEEYAVRNKAMVDRFVAAARACDLGDLLPTDFAENHDHYLHGAPKKSKPGEETPREPNYERLSRLAKKAALREWHSDQAVNPDHFA